MESTRPALPSHRAALRARRRRDVLISGPARWIATLVAVVLAMPMALMGLQTTAQLEAFHNRVLKAWPAGPFLSSPVEYVAGARAWAADRVYPIIKTAALSKELLLDLLGSAPHRRISLGSDGFVFLNGATENDVFGILEDVCVRSHRPETAQGMEQAIASLAQASARRGIEFDVVMVPTLPTIYADRLPGSVPQRLRRACLERANGRSPLVGVAEGSHGRFCYPLREMNAARGDDAFFPKANFHAYGKSLQVARDAWLDGLGLARPKGERLERAERPSEILAMYQIIRTKPLYHVRNGSLREDTAEAGTLIKANRDLFDTPKIDLRVFANPDAPNDESVLMLSDSYGWFASEVFAGAFRRLVHVTTNNLAEPKAPILLDRLARTGRFDRVVLLVQEANTGRVMDWAKAFADQH